MLVEISLVFLIPFRIISSLFKNVNGFETTFLKSLKIHIDPQA